MKALFLGHFAASVTPRILAKVKFPPETSILDDECDAKVLAPLLSEAEIVVRHIWRPSSRQRRAFACFNRCQPDSISSSPRRSRRG